MGAMWSLFTACVCVQVTFWILYYNYGNPFYVYYWVSVEVKNGIILFKFVDAISL
jgi:hypothetical protein